MEFVYDNKYRVCSVQYKDDKIIFDKNDVEENVITLDDIIKISVVTTSDGPWLEDVFWFIETKTFKYIIPIEDMVQGVHKLLPMFQKLPDFNNGMFIKAMQSVDLNEFLCWEKNKENFT
ncbi:MAG: hypothetical protein ACTSVV_14620 [Promethearchaeota archaeon]